MFPLPFSCQHEAYIATTQDEHGNAVPEWAAPVAVACFWWAPTPLHARLVEPAQPPTGGDLLRVDLSLVVDSAVAVNHRDMFAVDGRRFEVIGLPQDYDHGPFGFVPNRRIIALKWTG